MFAWKNRKKISHNIWKMYSPTRWIDSKEEKFYFVLIHQVVVNLHQKVRKSVLVIHKTELSSVFKKTTGPDQRLAQQQNKIPIHA